MPTDLTHALEQISEIRRQMARGSIFRGYRAQTTALTGVLALVLAAAQDRIIPQPWLNLPAYLGMWCGLAVISAAIFAPPLCCTGTWSVVMAASKRESNHKSDAAGRYAYEGLDRLIHERARLAILSSLATANDAGLTFNDLKDLCALTDGNLSRQL